jgi:uncharacterized SAM-binding protein YcdF (DUF218 family)
MNNDQDVAVDEAAELIWNYLRVDDALAPADSIVIFGGNDIRVAEWGATLFLRGFAPLVVCCGAYGKGTADWTTPEAEVFREVCETKGVPPDKILIENRSTNTGENIAFVRQLLQGRGIVPTDIIAVHKPYGGRRILATLQNQWPEVTPIVTSPPIGFRDYPTERISERHLISRMVGEMQRLQTYAVRGHVVAQEVPDNVLRAYEMLRDRGYTDWMVDTK